MKAVIRSCYLIACSLFAAVFVPAYCSSQAIALPNAYAHNDYWHKRPCMDALCHGFTHLEADVFLYKDRLVVAHLSPVFRKRYTLEKLYLQPLTRYFNSRSGQVQTGMDSIVLMIDIKSDAEKTYRALEILMEQYRPFLSSFENGILVKRRLTIVLTGRKSMRLLTQSSNSFFFVDDNLRNLTCEQAFCRISPIASCRYGSVIRWKGRGRLPALQKQQLCRLVAQAHAYGRKVRLWASPEHAGVWQELLDCGVDLINTNQLTALRRFFTTTGSNMAVTVH